MKNLKYLFTIAFVLILSTSIFAQVENTIKETKVKIEKQVEKAGEAVSDVKEMAADKTTKVKEECSDEAKKKCCDKTKAMKASISKKHGADCKCEGCTTAAAAHKGMKMMKKACEPGCEKPCCAKT